MEFERKGVTITWQTDVESLKDFHKQEVEFYSPVISVDALDRTKWKLKMFLEPTRKIRLTIKREAEDDGPTEIGLHYDVSMSIFGGTISVRKATCSFKFQKDQSCPEITMLGRHKYTFNSIIIRCKMWKQQGCISTNENVFRRTRIRVLRSKLEGVIVNFSDFPERGKRILKIVSSASDETLIMGNFNLHVSFLPFLEKDLQIEICSSDSRIERILGCKLLILDSSGNKSRIGKLSAPYWRKLPETYTLYGVTKENLIEKATLYLPNNTLSLHCEITYCFGEELEKVEGTGNETDSSPLLKEKEFMTLRTGTPCDTMLQTDTETFPAHTAILSAKSPVFEAMFKTSMKESIQKCVLIDDVDAETVHRMLLFLYSDTFGALECKEAMGLFIAADKYQILSLKRRCSALLEQSVDLSNCCDLLLLADMHQEEDLKKSVQNFITRNDQKILFCDQWRDFEKKAPQLAIDYFRHRCLKKRLY